MKIQIALFLLSLILFFSCTHLRTEKSIQSSRAPSNGSERGGGDALYCDGGLFGKKYYLSDTYEIFNSSKKGIFKLLEAQIPSQHKRDFVFELLSIGIANDRQEFFKKVRATVDQFKIVLEDEIEDIDDDNIVLPEGCSRKEQLAVHEIGTFRIRVKKSIYNQLSQTEKEFLLVHEVFIYAYYTWGYNIFDPEMKPADPALPKIFDTSKIRGFLAKLVAGPQFDHWMIAFRSFMSLPGLRLHDLLVKIKFTDFGTDKNIKRLYKSEPAELLRFLDNLKFQIATAVSIWPVEEKTVKNMQDGWVQTFAATLNNEKNQNMGILEFSCSRPMTNADFSFSDKRKMTIPDRQPVENGYCIINLVL